jgi:hypothetical protein
MPPPTDPQEYADLLNRAFDLMHEAVAKAVREFNKLVHIVNLFAWQLGTATLLWIKRNLDKVREALNQLIAKVRHATEHQLPVIALIKKSFAWVKEVRGPASDLSLRSTEPADEDLTKWTGDAFLSYNRRALGQRAAIDETAMRADFISQWLFTIARANVDYAAELAKIATAFAGHVVDALFEAAFVITIPWAIATVAEAAGALTTAGFNNLIEITRRLVAALGDARDLGSRFADNSKLPHGSWPQAVRG